MHGIQNRLQGGWSMGLRRRAAALALLLGQCLWLAPAGAAAATDVSAVAPPGPLVSADWLRQQLGRPGLHVVDASPPPQHRQRHIPGAVPADLFTFGSAEVPTARVEARLRSWGVGPRDHIVIVDAGGTWQGPRLVWDLLHLGWPAERLSLLDGGMAAWVAAGGAVSATATPAPPPGEARLGPRDEAIRVRLPEFLAASADPQRHVLLEALEPAYYYGGAAWFHRGGHVPHATLMPATDFFGPDKRFKPVNELRRMAAHLGIRPEQQVLSYCGGGGAAAVPFFAFRFLLGHPQVRLFQESQLAWLQDPRELPLWTYGRPALLRDTPWLKTWAGPMLKGMGMSRVTVLDVRPAAAHALGHVPLALSLPGLSAAAGGDAAALAALQAELARVGLDPSHEAVVLADGGLSPAAALAFARLEQLGQRQVSVYIDDVERWAESGGEVARPAPTVVAGSAAGAAARTPQAVFVGDAEAAAAAAAPGAVFLASGAQAPTRAAPGRVIHLPAAQLLQAGGRPLPAHEIWKRLAAAGVPRDRPIVLFADEAGDAALNYLLLRLMGLTGLSVWLPG